MWGEPTYHSGRYGREFERVFSERLDRRYGIAVANGTVALELALRAFGVGPGMRVAVPARSFIATIASVVNVGATPVFCDIDPETQCIDRVPKGVDAVIPVHLGGWPVRVDFDGLVIEDCAQAHGGSSGRRGDAACYSFCGDKIVSTGEGGMVVLDDVAAREKAIRYKDHGKLPHANYQLCHDSFGTNWRMTEHSAKLGLRGLKKLGDWHSDRVENARILSEALDDMGIRAPRTEGHAYYRLYAICEPEIRRKLIRRDIAEMGSCAELYLEKACQPYRDFDYLPGAREAAQTTVAFKVDPKVDIRRTIRLVEETVCSR